MLLLLLLLLLCHHHLLLLGCLLGDNLTRQQLASATFYQIF